MKKFYQKVLFSLRINCSKAKLFFLPFFLITFGTLAQQDSAVFNQLFVSPLGNNSNSGFSPTNPLKTISFALTRADQLSIGNIKLLSGTFYETIYLKGGINILGGYDNTGILQPSIVTILKYSEIEDGTLRLGVLIGENINLKTVVSNITIQSRDAQGTSQSSYGINLNNSSGIYFENVKIVSGIGADGLNGVLGQNGINGSNGFSGQNGNTYIGEGNSPQARGGAGGTSSYGSNGLPGGDGGYFHSYFNLFSYTVDAIFGGNECSNGRYGLLGANGSKGNIGVSFPNNGFLSSNNNWLPSYATDGGNGVNGGPGTGGEGGGACDPSKFINDQTYGSGGGGGGSGGQGGQGGKGGGGGGSSFGILAFNSSFYLNNCLIQSSNGGHGGVGGKGGDGGIGGMGGAGGASTNGAFIGGNGGFWRCRWKWRKWW